MRSSSSRTRPKASPTAVTDRPARFVAAIVRWPFAVVSVVAFAALAVAASRPMWNPCPPAFSVDESHNLVSARGSSSVRRSRPTGSGSLSVQRAWADRCVGEVSRRWRSGQPHGIDDPRACRAARTSAVSPFLLTVRLIAFDAGATQGTRLHATTRGPSRRRSAALRARSWNSVARCAGHRTDANRLCPAWIVGWRFSVRRRSDGGSPRE